MPKERRPRLIPEELTDLFELLRHNTRSLYCFLWVFARSGLGLGMTRALKPSRRDFLDFVGQIEREEPGYLPFVLKLFETLPDDCLAVGTYSYVLKLALDRGERARTGPQKVSRGIIELVSPALRRAAERSPSMPHEEDT